MIELNRRVLMTGAVAASAYACAKPVTAVPSDMSLGKADAPITFIEYASVACPVCGKWYRDNFEAFKAKYITTGKVHYIAREMLVGDSTEESIAAAGFLLARCAGKDRYFAVTDAIYKNQTDVYADPRGGLLRIAQSMGMNEAQFDACVKNEAALTALNKRVEGYVTTYNINSTPTFVINGKSMTPGYHSMAEIDAAIAAATPTH